MGKKRDTGGAASVRTGKVDKIEGRRGVELRGKKDEMETTLSLLS